MSGKAKTDSAPPRTKVFVVDRNALMRFAACLWVDDTSGLKVCGATGSMAAAFRAVRRLRPDAVVSEIMRPRTLGFIRELHRRHPRLLILVFSECDKRMYAGRALAAGARGYLSKEAGGERLVRSIRALLRKRREYSVAKPQPNRPRRPSARTRVWLPF